MRDERVEREEEQEEEGSVFVYLSDNRSLVLLLALCFTASNRLCDSACGGVLCDCTNAFL